MSDATKPIKPYRARPYREKAPRRSYRERAIAAEAVAATLRAALATLERDAAEAVACGGADAGVTLDPALVLSTVRRALTGEGETP